MKRNKNAHLCFETSHWQQYMWDDYARRSEAATQAVSEGKSKNQTFPLMGKEIFHRLFSTEEQPVDKVAPEAQWAAKIHTQLEQLPEFQNLRSRCKGDRFKSCVVGASLLSDAAEMLPEQEAPLQDPEPLRKQVRDFLRLLKHYKTEGIPAEQVGMLAELEQDIEALKKQGKAAVQAQLDAANQMADDDVRRACRDACARAESAIRDATERLEVFGWGSGPGSEDSCGSLDDKLRLMDTLKRNRFIREVAELAGRMRLKAQHKQRTKAEHERSEIQNVEQGADLARLLPSEAMKLSDPLFEMMFAKGMLERSLLQYRLQGKEKQKRGPIVVCLDKSGSMKGARNVWSSAVALALLWIAAHQKRSIRIIHFDDTVYKTVDFSSTDFDSKRVLSTITGVRRNGGTNFQRPLESALEAIQRDKDLKKADVIFLTDGECHVPTTFEESFLRSKKHYQFCVYTIIIGGYWGKSSLNNLSDTTIGLESIAEDSEVLDTVFSI